MLGSRLKIRVRAWGQGASETDITEVKPVVLHMEDAAVRTRAVGSAVT